MSLEAIDQLIESEEALTTALDGDTVDSIEAALQGFHGALRGVQSAGGWRDTPETVSRLARALALADAARVRTNYLADLNRRRLDRLTALAMPAARPLAYARDGRMRG